MSSDADTMKLQSKEVSQLEKEEEKDEGDIRECAICRILGDHDICGRLLPFETNWIHINCLLWSNEVLTEGHVIKQLQHVLNKSKNTVRLIYYDYQVFIN